MPCRCDDMDPNVREKESNIVCTHLLSLFTRGYLSRVDANVIKGANSIYGYASELDKHTDLLCSTIKSMSKDSLNALVYNGRNKDARKLADWWDKHQEADRIREEKEKQSKVPQKLTIEINCLTKKDCLERLKYLMDNYLPNSKSYSAAGSVGTSSFKFEDNV